MELTGKVAIITGASSGIGAATVKALHGIGMKVVGFARREEMIEQLINDHDGKLFAVKVDVTNQQEIVDGLAWVAKNVGPIHVLINNAGIATLVNVIDGDERIWKNVMDTNFNSVLMCCREAIKNMRDNEVDGYIINVSSVGGIRPLPFPSCSVYSASKSAICGMTENLRLELVRLGSKIRTTCMNPGVVKTDMSEKAGFPKETCEEFFKVGPYLLSEDIADTIKFLVQSPPHVQISNLTIQPVGERF